jgi:transcriptional regulator with XRE-family HTH domain
MPHWNKQKEGVFMYSEVFPSRLKKAREDYGLTQVETSELLKIGQSTLAKYETGKREPDLETLVKIGLLFDVSIDWLIGLTSKGNTDHLKEIREERNRKEILKKMERDALLAQRLERAN